MFPCCCSTCFKPCDCFARNCELHITSEGWTDNAATDCSGIANRVFNKTYAITSMNVTSGPAYGFTCEFLAGEDDLVLTKLSGGGCICQDQPAIYTIEGTLYCERGEDGTYSLRLVLYYKVPVYDETLTCPTPPCPEEPLWETWIWDYTLASGLSSSSAICDLGSSPIGPLGFNTDASAQTSCGLGLDGTDATVTVEWKFCDPLQSSCCSVCCNEDTTVYSDQISVTISGVTDNVCTDCELVDGTYVLDRYNSDCTWSGVFDSDVCTSGPLFITFWVCSGITTTTAGNPISPDNQCVKVLSVDHTSGTNPFTLFFTDNGQSYANGDPCPSGLDGLVLDSALLDCAFAAACCQVGATATIGIPA